VGIVAKEFHHQLIEASIMKLPHRRQFLRLAAGAATLPAASHSASAQPYPARPVRLIVAIAAGGSQDTIARLIAQWLTEQLGQQFIIENRPGAASNLGTEFVVRAPPDGYTLLLANTSNAINATLYEKLNFNFIRDIAPIAGIGRVASVMEVNPSFPAKTVPEFIAYAKLRPGKINMASGGTGNITHLQGELFKAMAGVDMVHVPYRGEALALTDLIGGQVQVLFGGVPPAIEHIRAGRLRALAVTPAARVEALPDVPTVGEFVTGYDASAWYGLSAPRNTSTEFIDTLNGAVNAGLRDPKMKARLSDLGVAVLAGSPTDFGRLISAETEKWAKVIRTANIKPE
jgi:tripartite-type tricarboxylate transporter receptor subunit TctC